LFLGGLTLSEHKPGFAFIFLLCLFGVAHPQSNPPASNQDVQIISAPLTETPLTPERFLPNAVGAWRASGASKATQGDALLQLPNGDVLKEYRVEKLESRTYVKGAAKHTVEVFGTLTWAGAYGLHTFFQLKTVHSFNAGRYAVRISGEAIDESFFNAVKEQFAEMSSRTPNLPTELPKPVEQVHYLWGSKSLSQNPAFAAWKEALSFMGGTEAVITNYANGNGKMNVMLIEYQTPQFADDGVKALQGVVNQQQLVKRIGNYVVIADQIQDRAAAESLISQIKYRKEIYWEGKKYSDIPLEYRGPDKTGLKEAAETAKMILRAFYWIAMLGLGTVILGIIAGSSVFYWRRYQRRKRGLDDLFSDAGGTIRLNLDDFLLEAKNEKQKLLKEAE
jgi:hypothetical protein